MTTPPTVLIFSPRAAGRGDEKRREERGGEMEEGEERGEGGKERREGERRGRERGKEGEQIRTARSGEGVYKERGKGVV